ncbi:hypothetical protein GBF38_015531 [Nibea albiflora]|uniref:Uncharacterized protein n=1 Tax=Nibea albiflora TaxID=240163 RepID=A0ACB7ELJ6_NIBAL|nr:hypothetical protein GBF38_015531 [Nibea albiflora]
MWTFNLAPSLDPVLLDERGSYRGKASSAIFSPPPAATTLKLHANLAFAKGAILRQQALLDVTPPVSASDM